MYLVIFHLWFLTASMNKTSDETQENSLYLSVVLIQ